MGVQKTVGSDYKIIDGDVYCKTIDDKFVKLGHYSEAPFNHNGVAESDLRIINEVVEDQKNEDGKFKVRYTNGEFVIPFNYPLEPVTIKADSIEDVNIKDYKLENVGVRNISEILSIDLYADENEDIIAEREPSSKLSYNLDLLPAIDGILSLILFTPMWLLITFLIYIYFVNIILIFAAFPLSVFISIIYIIRCGYKGYSNKERYKYEKLF